MCIVSFAWQAHPRWKFIAIGNRDELHARPAAPLSRWTNPDHILAGRDIQAGGTWLGVSEKKRFAVVTNLSGHGAPSPDRSSRGDLLKDYLANEGRFSSMESSMFSEFNPFNLITVTNNQARIHSNRPGSTSTVLEPGTYGLSNGPLDRPWKKSKYLNEALNKWLISDSINLTNLLDPLLNRSDYRSDKTGESNISLASEPEHSPVFIHSEIYGTRCSTVVGVQEDGRGTIIERRYNASGQTTGETSLAFTWQDH